ncbi:MAG: cyclase [Candidatus Nephthysia bennettiae]|uniref:SRPBCC family protein n=2 Tax=Candidatus Nephthysia bennettiae TaxID=3127016 RepID=A0A934K9U0_9BACT|nr:SRPBCC family protein [Candidatus Dormibacteraeota bacterium]MBJ7613888.1 SRPBCC family protein [Candidatus Dormibacteraeota bacterium]PZR97989.1 MAG: cyclase [Candidatus Dormibacteraeota bacterium]
MREAYNQWTQFESFPQFMEGVKEVRQLDDKRLHWRAEVGGREEEWDAEITEQIPDTRIAWRSIGGRPNAGVVDFHRLNDENTQVSLQLDAEPEGVLEKIGEKAGFLDRQVQGDLERFKDFITTRGAATGEWRGDIDPPHRN